MNRPINEILTDIRKKSKLSRKALESISGFKSSTIESYERGIRKTPDKYIEFTSLYFGYKEDYIRGLSDDNTKIDKAQHTLLMYQSIYDYDDDKISKLLKMNINEYRKLLNSDLGGSNFKIIIEIAKKLNISFSCISYFTIVDEVEATLDDKYLKKAKDFKLFYDDIKDSMKNRNMIDELNKNGINITPEYYANIIKKRNQPKENYTPTSELNEIPQKYKEILELLPFAPDSFINTLTEKLRTLKETQQL